MARTSGLFVCRAIEDSIGRRRQNAWWLRFQSDQRLVLHCGWNTGESRKPHRRMDAKNGNESHQQRHARCRHAALESRKEHDVVCRTSHTAAPERARAGGRRCAMSKFVREELTINGVKTVVHTAGKGEPLVLFH